MKPDSFELMDSHISRQKQLEQQLLEYKGRLENFSQQVPGMLYQFEILPDGRYRVPYASDVIKEYYGCTPEEVKEDFGPMAAAIHPEDLARLSGDIQASISTSTPFTCEYRVQVPGQPLRWIWAKAMWEMTMAGTILFNGFNTDITEQKQSEIKLKETSEEMLQLIRTLESRKQRSDRMLEMSQILQTCNEIEEAYKVIEEYAKQIFTGTSGALFVTEGGNSLMDAALNWGNKLYSEIPFGLDECWALRKGQLHVVGPSASRLLCKHMAPSFEGYYLGIPIAVSDEKTSMLHVEWENGQEDSESIVETAKLFANTLTVSFENIDLRQRLPVCR